MKKLLSILIAVVLLISSVFAINAVVYYYGGGGLDITLNFYIDKAKTQIYRFTDMDMKVSCDTDNAFLSVESTVDSAAININENKNEVEFSFEHDEGIRLREYNPFLSIKFSMDGYNVEYSVESLKGLDLLNNDMDETKWGKDIVATDLHIPECETQGIVCIMNVNEKLEVSETTTEKATDSTIMTEPTDSEAIIPTEPSESVAPTEPTAETQPATEKIVKKKQPMTVGAFTKTVKASKLKKTKVTVKNAITVKKNQGAVSYSKSGGSKYLSISKNGVITVKKGKYKKNTVLSIKVKITAKGNANYKSGSKTVTVKIKVK